MPNKRPWMPLYIDDYDGDTRHLTPAEDGIYGRLLRAMWRAGGQLPKDERALALIARISLFQWRRMAPKLMPFFMVVGDRLEQKRLGAELRKIQEVSQVRSAAAKKSRAEQSAKTFEDSELAASNRTPSKRLNSLNGAEANAQRSSRTHARADAHNARAPTLYTSHTSTDEGSVEGDARARVAVSRNVKIRQETSWPHGEDWLPAGAYRKAALAIGVPENQIDREGAQWRDKALANGATYKDWLAAWRTWCRNWLKYAGRRTVIQNSTGPPSFSAEERADQRFMAEQAKRLRNG